MTDAPLRIGLVGAGMASQLFHLPHYADNPLCRIVVIADQRPKLASEVAARWQIPEIVSHEEQLFDRPDIDAVVIVAPRRAMAPLVLCALEAGKHVLSEKPMAYTAAEAQRLVDAAGSRGLIYTVGFMKRYDSGVARTRVLLSDLERNPRLGALLLARFHNFSASYAAEPGPFIRYDEKRPARLPEWSAGPAWLPGGLSATYDKFLNVASHDINLMRYLLGDELRVGSAHLGGNGGLVACLVRGEVPVSFDLAAASTGEWLEGAEFLFEKGRVLLELPSPVLRRGAARLRVEGPNSASGGASVGPDDECAFHYQARAFVEDVRSHITPRSSGQSALGDLVLIENIWKTAILRDR
ncbi:MAG TPA: Gfo/Idh/MocA family oxidoreductase [Aliidongia sp.]|nr:Gfo/Idh/MocA family oxidoreductase [Aliidongia sp.]